MRNGLLIDNLTKDDFEVFARDAVPQRIAFLARSVDVPLTLGLIMDASGSQSHYDKQSPGPEVFLNELLGPRDRAFLILCPNSLHRNRRRAVSLRVSWSTTTCAAGPP